MVSVWSVTFLTIQKLMTGHSAGWAGVAVKQPMRYAIRLMPIACSLLLYVIHMHAQCLRNGSRRFKKYVPVQGMNSELLRLLLIMCRGWWYQWPCWFGSVIFRGLTGGLHRVHHVHHHHVGAAVCLHLLGTVHWISVLSPKATTQARQHPKIMSKPCVWRLRTQQSVSPTVHKWWPQSVESRLVWVQIRSYVWGVPADRHVKGTFVCEVDESIFACA